MHWGLIKTILILPGTVLVFLAGNMMYMPLVEEKGLIARFGDPYREYRDRVPRWVPRLERWDR